ncbi:hypothetical protein [Actinoplanes teichomyceticus]|uniref:Uncharacterized protein n=1 Tax=Actinoplanes teichomyceticus TaxID=1867 RepID=A0A561WR15_ACTTI|nr:hypothetical protein [Actinoplanes teichomyceticus]TWG26307.1 hypothetical protein FHX34_1011288 [Actinoplanes teichomyceticus]GIF11386.1 hypothetical protein Ate01nite_14180 [Actinoplanes teichomyceticus]
MTTFRLSPVLTWGIAAVTVLITAFVLWLGWPAEGAGLPAGASEVEVHFIDDELTTPAPTGEKDGWFGSLSTPCDFDSWYVESAGTAVCATLGERMGTVTVNRTGQRIELPADAQKAITAWAADAGGTRPPARALLVVDGEPVGIVAVAAPAVATPAS